MRRRWFQISRSGDDQASSGDRLARLAARIGELAEKDERTLRHAHDIGLLRRRAAGELYAVCSGFVVDINALLPHPELALDPPEYPESAFNEDGVNLLQINVRGRLLQIEFEATPETVSTEDFRIPYTLSGSIRTFNQDLLDRETIEEQLLFYCLEKTRRQWRFFDARTYRSGPFDRDYLISLMEQLI